MNDVVGNICQALELGTALRRVLSFKAEGNPLLCGAVPPGLAVDWAQGTHPSLFAALHIEHLYTTNCRPRRFI